MIGLSCATLLGQPYFPRSRLTYSRTARYLSLSLLLLIIFLLVLVPPLRWAGIESVNWTISVTINGFYFQLRQNKNSKPKFMCPSPRCTIVFTTALCPFVWLLLFPMGFCVFRLAFPFRGVIWVGKSLPKIRDAYAICCSFRQLMPWASARVVCLALDWSVCLSNSLSICLSACLLSLTVAAVWFLGSSYRELHNPKLILGPSVALRPMLCKLSLLNMISLMNVRRE